MAAATTTILSDEEIKREAITTIDLFSRFMRPVSAAKVERLRAEARVVRAGGRLVWTEAEVLADGEMVGKFAATGIRVAFDPQAYIAERGGGNGSTGGGGDGGLSRRGERRPRPGVPRGPGHRAAPRTTHVRP